MFFKHLYIVLIIFLFSFTVYATNINCTWSTRAELNVCMTNINSLSLSDRAAVFKYELWNANANTDLDYDNEQTLFSNLTLLTNLV